jgi:hypothetical protein
MRLLMAPIDCVARFNARGEPRPVKFRVAQEAEAPEVKVDRILCLEEERLAGNRMLVFRCQSVVRGAERVYELKYEVATCRWFLAKM